MRWSWETTARYLFSNKKFVVSIPLNRYAIPRVRSVEFCPVSNSLRIVGEIHEEHDRPLKQQSPIIYKTYPETNPLVECESKELR